VDDTNNSPGFIPQWAADPGGYTVPAAVGLPMDAYTPLPADVGDMAQMQPYAPLGNAMPWWQQFALFGATKAVDNLSRVTVTGNTDTGSFGGYNGGTYSQNPQGTGGGATRTSQTTVAAKLTGSPVMLLALAAVAFVLLKK
jgi:hypothetical protein